MQPAGRSRKRSFARDFGIASLVAVPLSIAAGYLLLAGDGAPPRPTLRSAATATLAAVSTKSAEAPAVAAVVAEAPPVVPYFEIRPTAGPRVEARPTGPVAAAPVPDEVPAARPRVSDAGWEARAVRPPRVRAGAWVALVIDDLGLDRARAARTAALPGPLTMSFMSYAPDVGVQAGAARQAGHEIMLHMPMEPEGREDPGPGALFVGMPADDIRARVAAAFDRLPMAVGLNNHMGSRFTRDARALRPVMDEIAARGLLFVDSRTSGGSVAAGLALDMGLAAGARDVFLDNELDAGAVRKQLAELERVATRKGMAIAIGHPHDATIEALAAWIPTMNSRGLQLVPVSAIVRNLRRDPAGRDAVAMGGATSEPPAPRLVPARTAVPAPEPVAQPAVAGYEGEPPWMRFPAR